MTDKNEEQKRLIWRIKNQPERSPEQDEGPTVTLFRLGPS